MELKNRRAARSAQGKARKVMMNPRASASAKRKAARTINAASRALKPGSGVPNKAGGVIK